MGSGSPCDDCEQVQIGGQALAPIAAAKQPTASTLYSQGRLQQYIVHINLHTFIFIS
jgi:hypothetical protein